MNSSHNLLTGRRYYVIGGNYAVAVLFKNAGGICVDSIAEADIVVWTGGSDVTPALYKETQHPKTYCTPQRDRFEEACWKQASLSKGKIKIGICRGAQFLNVMNGGSLWQHVDNHGLSGHHVMLLSTKVSKNETLARNVMVNSTHHQMMIPNSRNTTCEVWGSAGESTFKEAGKLLSEPEKTGIFKIEPRKGHMTDCEIVFYRDTKSLCFQPHPEYDSVSTRDVFWTCVERVMAA